MLKLNNSTKSYGTSQVLCGASLVCRPGQALCLVGANAAGKTTLLTIAAGLQKADGGTVEYAGRLGYVPQETALLEDLTLRDNLRLWYAACNRPVQELFSEGTAEHALCLAPYAKKRISTLSGGIKKRTAIACALAAKPAFLLMDEPFAALDLTGRDEIAALFCRLKAEQMGILFSSHNPAAIAAAADRIALLSGGVIWSEQELPEDAAQRSASILELLCKA